MANALGTLFKDIADAIRSKTGDTGTMKPADFPIKIGEISAGAGGGSTVEGLTFSNGSFKATQAIQTVSHDLGFVPDMLIVYSSAAPKKLILYYAMSFSKAFIASCSEAASFTLYMNNTGAASTMSIATGHEEPISDFVAGYGFIRNVTSTTFTVGGSNATLDTTASTGYDGNNSYTYTNYHWVAISGIT